MCFGKDSFSFECSQVMLLSRNAMVSVIKAKPLLIVQAWR